MEKAVKKNEVAILQMNKEQLKRGVFPDGASTPLYSLTTLEQKALNSDRNIIGNGKNWSLSDSGDLYSQMQIKIKGLILEIYTKSASGKRFDMWVQSRYQFGIERFFGLDTKHEDDLINLILPEIEQGIKKIVEDGMR